MILISKSGRNGRISGDVNGNVLDVVRDMPGRHKMVYRDVIFELSSGNLEHLKRELPNAMWSNEMKDMLFVVRAKREEEEKVRELKKVELPAEAFNFPFKLKPFDHQAKAFFLGRDHTAFALFMEMGTGKTKVLIDMAAHLYSKGEIDTLFVVAPNGVHRQWIEEQIPTHLPDWVPYKAGFQQSTLTLQKKKELREVLEYKDGLRIVALNIEALSHESGVKFAKSVLCTGRCLFAIDESTRIKTPGSKRTKTCLALASYAPYRRILSGAPVTKGVEDLYAQMRFLDPDILGFSSYYTFRNRYCVMGGYEYQEIVGYKNVEELQKRLDGWSFRVTKKECLDLPDKVYMNHYVELHPEQKKLYKQLKEDLFTQLPDGSVVDAGLVVTLMMRLQQVICGFLPNPDTKEAVNIISYEDNPRIQACGELIQNAQGKVIVWARFHGDILNISRMLMKLKIDFVTYHGLVDTEGRKTAVEKFRNDDKVKVFLANPAAAGIGLNLAVAETMIYYSNDFNADARWQSEDRAHRIGMVGGLTCIDLIAPKTMDEKIVKALKDKKSLADLVVDRKSVEDLLS